MELPVLPLNAVLFPGGRLPLHIFEERYKLMISRCVERGEPFGVCLIRRGSEVGEAAVEPFRVGTTAHIRELQELAEGRLNIVCTGGQRFTIREISDRLGQPFGNVQHHLYRGIDRLRKHVFHRNGGTGK